MYLHTPSFYENINGAILVKGSKLDIKHHYLMIKRTSCALMNFFLERYDLRLSILFVRDSLLITHFDWLKIKVDSDRN